MGGFVTRGPIQLLEPQWFFLFFCCLWFFISAALSLGGGWFSLSREFRTYDDVSGERFRFRSGSLGRWPFPVTGYGNCLFLTVNDRGFRLSILFLFRFLSPPLYIPWSAVQSVQSKRFLFVPYALIRLKRGWPAIAIRGDAGEYLAGAYARRGDA